MRWAMVLHNQYPWDRSRTELRRPADIGDDDFVVAFHPRQPRRRWRSSTGSRAGPCRRREHAVPTPARRRSRRVAPVRPYPPVRVREAFAVAAGDGGAGRGAWRARLRQRRRHPQRQLLVVADERGRDRPQDRDRGSGATPAGSLEQLALDAARAALAKSDAGARGDRRGAGQHLHQQPADPVDRLLAVRRAGPAADPRLGRHGRGLRRPALRPRRGGPAAAGGPSGRSCWCASRSSPTRSAARAPRG